MASHMGDRDPPSPGRAASVEAQPIDLEHPKRPLPPVTLSTKPLDRAVEDLKELRSPDIPVVSAYWDVPADLGMLKGGVSALKDLVRPVRERAHTSELSHAARMSLLADADRMLELEHLVPGLQGRSLAFFRCSAHGFEEAVAAPGGLADRVEIDATPFLRPLISVVEESHRYAVAVVGREDARLFEFYLGVLDAKEREHGRALRNPNYAEGDKEYGVHRKAEELAKRHYRRTAELLQRMVQEDGVELVVLGGHHDVVSAFSEELPAELRRKVVGSFVIDPHTMTPASARDEAQRAVDEYERQEEVTLVQQAMERVVAGGLGALGLEWCLLAATELAVDTLLLEATALVPGVVCDRCGWLAREGVECPIDGTPTRAVPDVLDEMATRVLDSSGRVEHVHVETALRDHLVAALLRFPVPDPSGTP